MNRCADPAANPSTGGRVKGRRDGVPLAHQAEGSRTRHRREQSRHEERGRFLRHPGDGRCGTPHNPTRQGSARPGGAPSRPASPPGSWLPPGPPARVGPVRSSAGPPSSRSSATAAGSLRATGTAAAEVLRARRESDARPKWPSPAVPGAARGTIPPSGPPDRCRCRRSEGRPVGLSRSDSGGSGIRQPVAGQVQFPRFEEMLQ